MIGKEIIVKGRVQGVGFRQHVLKQAQVCGIKGYVKNQYNGNVFIIAFGKSKDIDLFTQLVRAGNSYSRVEKITSTELINENSYRGFSIK